MPSGPPTQGFIVSPRLGRMIHADFAENHAPDVIAYFSKPDGSLLNAGERLVNKPYADFLRRLAAQGPAALYSGSTAAKIVARTHAGPLGGSMTMADLADYKPIKREPVCGPFRIYLLCAPPPPSSGVGLVELMMILDRTDIAARGPNDPQAWFLFAEASRLMYADRDKYVGDPAFVKVPVAGLIDPAYVAERAKLIGATAGPPPAAGIPRRAVRRRRRQHARADRHLALHHPRRRRQCRVDDHHGRNRSSAPGGWSTASSSTTS